MALSRAHTSVRTEIPLIDTSHLNTLSLFDQGSSIIPCQMIENA